MIWHSSPAERVVDYFNVDIDKGLPTGVAEQRNEEYGLNLICAETKSSLKDKIFEQLKSFTNLTVIVCAVMAVIANILSNEPNWYAPILIVAVLLVNAAFSIYVDIQAENAIQGVKTISSQKVRVIRDGIIKTVDASLVTPGDIILIETGSFIPADARLIESVNLHCDESALTGDIVSVEKQANAVFDDITKVNERANMIYSGTTVVSGKGKAVITDIGMQTEIGKRITLLNVNETKDIVIKDRLAFIGKISGRIMIAFVILVYVLSVLLNFRNTETAFAVMLLNNLLNSFSLLVSVLPESLASMSTIAVAVAVTNLVSRSVIVKDLSVFDRLPFVSVICADKTGTLTHNKMAIEKIFDGRNLIDVQNDELTKSAAAVARLAALLKGTYNTDTSVEDQTELAIDSFFAERYTEESGELNNRYPRLCSIPFDADRKRMTSINLIDGKPVAIVKGAPDSLAKCCQSGSSEIIKKITEKLAFEEYRVIALAVKPLNEIPTSPTPEEIENDLIFVGIIALNNPPRNAAISYVEECNSAGIKTVMVTGDHLETAKTVARRIGILKDGDLAITGEELENLSDEEFESSVQKYSVFARMLSREKFRIVKAYKNCGKTVAVTGENVDDAAALTLADVGIANGNFGTDIARGASDIIMLSGSYGNIIDAIKESQNLIIRIAKSIVYLISSNIGELLFVLIGLILFGKFPIIACQLLLMNLFTDTLPVFALLKTHYRDRKIKTPSRQFNIFTTDNIVFTAVQSVVISVTSLIGYAMLSSTPEKAQSCAFFVLCFAQLFNMFTINHKCELPSFKGKKISVLQYLTIAVYLLVILLTVTPMGAPFGFSALNGKYFLNALILSLITLLSGVLVPFGFKLYKKFISK